MSDSLYEIFRSKCFALAYTTVIHSRLEALAQNVFLEQKGYVVDHSNPSSWKYYMNLAGLYHDYDKALISELNADNSPFIKIKIAGDNKPVEVNFVKELLTGVGGDYTLAAEYRYGSSYYKELVERYPGCESLILGILNPIDMQTSTQAENGAILYCGGYYRKRLPHILKEHYGFEKREDVTIDSNFLIEDWEQDLIYDIQDYIKLYLKRWEIQDFQANHAYYAAAVKVGLISGLIPVIEKLRLKNIKHFNAHSYHVREYINSYGYLGRYVDALTREQAMYLYHNMDWLVTNKGKAKTLQKLMDNLLTPSNIPLTAYNIGHDNWEMQVGGSNTPIAEFKKEELNIDSGATDTGTDTKTILVKEEKLARDNGLFIDERTLTTNEAIEYSNTNSLKTKVLESSYTEWDSNLFFSLEEFQYHNWIYSVAHDNYRGSVFVNHPVTGGRLQLTAKTALILFLYAQVKGYYGYELETFPPLVVRNIPKDRTIYEDSRHNYPTNDDLWQNVLSKDVTQDKITRMANFPIPTLKYTSTIDFYNKTLDMFEVLETRRGYASMENDISANGEMELVSAKFYHMFVMLDPLMDDTYPEWLSRMGLDLTDLDQFAFQRLADDLVVAGVGLNDATKRSAARMHSALMEIVRYFLSYTVQLISDFSSSSYRLYGYKILRISQESFTSVGEGYANVHSMDIVEAYQHLESEWWAILGTSILDSTESHIVGEAWAYLNDLWIDQGCNIEVEKDLNFLGFMQLADDENQEEPYVDPITEDTSYFVSDTIMDIHTLPGPELTIVVTPDTVEFLDNLGLKPVQDSDFIFTIDKNGG